MKSTVLEGISVELQSGFSHFTRILRGCFEVSCFFRITWNHVKKQTGKGTGGTGISTSATGDLLKPFQTSGSQVLRWVGGLSFQFFSAHQLAKIPKKLFMRTSRIISYIIERSKNKKHVEVDGSPQPVFERYQKGFKGYIQYRVVRASGKPTRGLATSNLALAFKVQVIHSYSSIQREDWCCQWTWNWQAFNSQPHTDDKINVSIIGEKSADPVRRAQSSFLM